MLKEIDGVSFLNIDHDKMYFDYAEKEDARFELADLNNGLPKELLVDEPVSFVNMSEFLEHLNLPAAQNLLVDCYSYMDVGATIRVSVPDTELLLFHLKTNKMDAFAEQQPRAWFDKYDSQMMKFSLLLFGSLHENGDSGHKMCYDFESLKELLEKVGFTKVKRCKYDERYDAPVAANHQLCVSAVKL